MSICGTNNYVPMNDKPQENRKDVNNDNNDKMLFAINTSPKKISDPIKPSQTHWKSIFSDIFITSSKPPEGPHEYQPLIYFLEVLFYYLK